MTDDERRIMLGQFIRLHRERMRPAVPKGRRRTPGLRREELAELVGIGATWCSWIEQGRAVGASPATLSRLAHALRLTPAERAYMFELAGRGDPDATPAGSADEAPASLRALVMAVKHPAYGLDPLWNACSWNPAAERLFPDWLRGEGQKNLLWYVFVDPSARRLIPDWASRAARILAEFRADFGRLHHDPRIRELVSRIREASEDFARAWDRQSVLGREGGLRRFLHPEDGPMAYEQYTFNPADRPDYKLVVLMPPA